MCIMCERELWGEHRALESEFFEPCKTCKKFPGTSSEGTCYHCFAIGNTIDECAECVGKPWSVEFLEANGKSKAQTSCCSPFSANPMRPLRISDAGSGASLCSLGAYLPGINNSRREKSRRRGVTPFIGY